MLRSHLQQRTALDAGRGCAYGLARQGGVAGRLSPSVIGREPDVDVVFHRPDEAQSPLVGDAQAVAIALLTDTIMIKSDVPIRHIHVDSLQLALNQAKARDAH